MFNWFNMKKKSLPEQVLQNTKDIEKLYDQELSDITQLNYKQDAEESLTYADGKATFKGKMSIIRNENTQNLVVDSEIEVNISSGDDDIIIDAGEDNVSLKIRLDNETRNNILRALKTPISAPTEDEFVVVGTNNAQKMIESSKIEKTENKINEISGTNVNNINYPTTHCMSSINRYGFKYEFVGESLDDLLNWVKDTAPQGYYRFYWSHGSVDGVEVMKASSQYATVKVTSYFMDILYRVNTLEAGVWTGWKTIQKS